MAKTRGLKLLFMCIVKTSISDASIRNTANKARFSQSGLGKLRPLHKKSTKAVKTITKVACGSRFYLGSTIILKYFIVFLNTFLIEIQNIKKDFKQIKSTGSLISIEREQTMYFEFL
jgi:hypothetical protein